MNTKPAILLVDDEPATQFGFCRYLNKAGYEIRAVSSLAEAREVIFARHYDAVLLDLHLPDGNGMDWVPELRQSHLDTFIVIITGHGDIPSAVEAIRRGADQFLTKPVNMTDLDVFLRKGLELGTLRRVNAVHRRLAKREFEPWFGASDAMRRALDLATTASRNDSTVLIMGETGSGKGVLARWIYGQSARSAAPLVDLNCSSLKGELLASELFGHAKGAFTSAVDEKQGLVEVAHGGTLFLDEIGDMDIVVQAQFLKVIEEKRFRRVGEVKVRTSEFRLICATNHNIEEQCREGKFRQDLYFRINVFPIEVPPLRAMKADIPGLAAHIAKTLASHDVELQPDVIKLLVRYPWPGNVRELRNVLERALMLAQGKSPTAEHFPGLSDSAVTALQARDGLNLDQLEETQIRAVMDRFAGDTEQAAAALGISRATLYRRLKKMKETPGSGGSP